MSPVKLHPNASREVEESAAWYELQAAGLGPEFLDEVDRAMAAVAVTPETWPLFFKPARRYLLHRFPYALVSVHDASGVRVLAVMHLHRRPDYWLDRMGR